MSDAAIRAGLYSKLTTGNATLQGLVGDRVYDTDVPASATYPLIVFSLYSGTDSYTFSQHAYTDDLWLVKAIDRDDSGDSADDAIADLIFTVLNDQALTLVGLRQLYLRRQRRVRYPERKGDVVYRHAAGIYALWTA